MPAHTRPLAQLVTILALFAHPVCVAAQDASAATDASENAGETPFALDIDRADPALRAHLADHLVRNARRRLLLQQDPQPVEYRFIADLIEGARTLNPPDADLIRLETEARLAGLQADRADALARELLRIDPADEIAQLRVAIDAIRERQTAIGRLEAYELFLGPRGGSFSKAVRSRLAVDAALLARERGSERQFIDYLTLATTLDPSNKEAAALYASHFLALTDDPTERIDLLTNVVLADPLDPEAMQNLALELVNHGAYDGAYEVLRHTFAVYSLRRQTPPLRMRIELTLSEWNAQGTDHLIEYTQNLEDTIQGRIDTEREIAFEQGLDPGPEREALLPLELEALRLAAGIVKRDEEYTKRMLERCIVVGENAIPGLRENAPDAATAQDQIDAMELTLLWCRLFAGQDLDAARAQFETFTDPDHSSTLAPIPRQRFEGWFALLEGDAARARELIEPIADRDRHAKWVLAMIEEAQGNTRQALFHYAGLAQRFANTAIGSAAWFRAEELYEGDLTRSDVAQRLSEEAGLLVEWLESRFLDPRKYMAVEVRNLGPNLSTYDGGEIEITVRNRTSWPLAVGPTSPIPSRVLLTPVITFGTGDLVDATEPEAIAIPGRLRLNANEEVVFRVRTARRLIADTLDVASIQRSTVRWQATLGFAHNGQRAASTPLSVGAQSGISAVRRIPASAEPDVLVNDIRRTTGLPNAIALRTAAFGASELAMQQLGIEENLISQRRNVLLNALAADLQDRDEAARIATFFAVSTPVVRISGPDYDVFRLAYQDDTSPYLAAAIAGVGLVRDLDHPMLAVLKASSKPWARAMARNLEDTILIANRIRDLSEEALQSP